MNNATVKVLQKILNCKGYIISESGAGSLGKETTLFGPKTRTQVINFQRDNKLKIDGIIGPEFRAFINK
jgi:peptidoglycan hydrolase-like protein with peptidoglycan-binding domain